MPLPDERPRQSVANLIGRFEQQSKRASNAGTGTNNRPSSIISHITGDSAKEEVKEKREWPPRNVATAVANVPEIVPTSNATTQASTTSLTESGKSDVTEKGSNDGSVRSPVARNSIDRAGTLPLAQAMRKETTSVLSSAPEAILKKVDPPISPTTQNNTQVPPPPLATTVADTPVNPRSSGKLPMSSRAKTSSSSASASITTPVKSPVPTRSATLKATPKGPTTPSKSPPVTKPLKAQLTGQSTTSNVSTVRARSRIGHTATSTPVRAKTPAGIISRPKTPSSGLYAPTAASLAKAKNAPPLPSTPARKPTTSVNASAVLERLSKPTAASASKARAPMPSATTGPIAAKNGTRGGVPTRGTVKPRVGLAPARMKQEREKTAAKSHAKPAAAKTAAPVAGDIVATTSMVETVKTNDVPGSVTTEDVPLDVNVDQYTEPPSFVSEEPSFSVDRSALLFSSAPGEEELEEDEHLHSGSEAEEIESYDDAYLDETIDHTNIRVSTSPGEASFAASSFAVSPNEKREEGLEDEDGDTSRILPASPEPLSMRDKEEKGETEEVHGPEDEENANEDGDAPDTPTTAVTNTNGNVHPEPDEFNRLEDETKTANEQIHVETPSVTDHQAPVDEIESMVHMLEFASKRPPSTVSSVMDSETAGTIPDEE